jgi:GT2 family glycosyltransferase
MWGTHWRQRVRLAPLYLAIAAADGLAPFVRHRRAARLPPARPGVSVIIPERDAPDLLHHALRSAVESLAALGEPSEIIVVVNGAPATRYEMLAAAFPAVHWIQHAAPLGFSAAVERGLARARFDSTFLMNNDMTVDGQTLRALAAQRAPDVFAVAAQIFQESADGRREETGFVDWYAIDDEVRVYHAAPPGDDAVREHLCASGGASLFRTAVLARYVRAARDYNPFYWEDVDWGVRAWEEGMRVLYCPDARAWHRHRQTTSRFYTASELTGIVERNRLLFAVRHAVACPRASQLLRAVCALPYAGQREFARPSVAARMFRHRLCAAHAASLPPPRLQPLPGKGVAVLAPSWSYRLRANAAGESARPRVLVVTPFAVYPPQHGGARRVAGLLRVLRARFDVIQLTDEALLYDARSFAHFDGLYAVHLVQRREQATDPDGAALAVRMRAHVHDALASALDDALRRYAPGIVQIEHIELAELIRAKVPGQRWVLGLHDAYGEADFADAAQARRFRDDVLAGYDAVTVCSPEDRELVDHPRIVCVRNGTDLAADRYRQSVSQAMLFMGPFRYGPNLDGIRAFLAEAYPRIRAAVPGATLRVLGGHGAASTVAGDPLFAQRGVEMLDHRDDVARQLDACALTINPLEGIRGSAVKLVESLRSGRVCVSTTAGARGFLDVAPSALVLAANVAAMVEPCVHLLHDADARHRLEMPDPAALAQFGWDRCAQPLVDLYAELGAAR